MSILLILRAQLKNNKLRRKTICKKIKLYLPRLYNNDFKDGINIQTKIKNYINFKINSYSIGVLSTTKQLFKFQK